MIIDKHILDELTEQAKTSPRLRMNYDLRNSSEDGSQRMLNALEPGTMIMEVKDGPYKSIGEEDLLAL